MANDVMRTDLEYRAARHLLLRSRLKHTASRFITPDHIDFEGLMGECFSSSEILLCRAANDIWNGQGGATLGDLINRLDDHNYRALLDTLALFDRRRELKNA